MSLDIGIILAVVTIMIPVGVAAYCYVKSEVEIGLLCNYLEKTYPDQYSMWTKKELETFISKQLWLGNVSLTTVSTGPLARSRALQFLSKELPRDGALQEKIAMIKQTLLVALFSLFLFGIMISLLGLYELFR